MRTRQCGPTRVNRRQVARRLTASPVQQISTTRVPVRTVPPAASNAARSAAGTRPLPPIGRPTFATWRIACVNAPSPEPSSSGEIPPHHRTGHRAGTPENFAFEELSQYIGGTASAPAQESRRSGEFLLCRDPGQAGQRGRLGCSLKDQPDRRYCGLRVAAVSLDVAGGDPSDFVERGVEVVVSRPARFLQSSTTKSCCVGRAPHRGTQGRVRRGQVPRSLASCGTLSGRSCKYLRLRRRTARSLRYHQPVYELRRAASERPARAR